MNRLGLKDRAGILGMLVKGNSMRATSCMADVSINTVTKLLMDTGAACADHQNATLRNLSCKRYGTLLRQAAQRSRYAAGPTRCWRRLDMDRAMAPERWNFCLRNRRSGNTERSKSRTSTREKTTASERQEMETIENRFGGFCFLGPIIRP